MEETLIKSLVEAGGAGLMAGALIIVVVLMLRHFGAQAKEERAQHNEEVDRVLVAHKESIDRVVAAHDLAVTRTLEVIERTSTAQVTAMNDLKSDLRQASSR